MVDEEISLVWMLLDHTNDKSTLVQVIAWGRQEASHYLSQGWPSFMQPCAGTRPQWVKLDLQHLSGENRDVKTRRSTQRYRLSWFTKFLTEIAPTCLALKTKCHNVSRYWWHRRLSSWQPTVPSGTKKLALWQIYPFSDSAEQAR